MRKIYSICLVVFVLALNSCDVNTINPVPVNNGFDYYPATINKYWIYDVTAIRHTLIDGIDTLKYQSKEVIADTFSDITGEKSYLIEIYTRTPGMTQWPGSPDSTAVIRYTDTHLIRTENNTATSLLLSKLKELTTWNRNSWNGQDTINNIVVNVSKPLEINSIQFDNTAKVVQSGYFDQGKLVEADSNRVYYKRQYEIYAHNVGLIEQQNINIIYVQKDGQAVDPPQVEAGSTEYFKKLVSYGEE